jgi:anti-sigma factor RsiW
VSEHDLNGYVDGQLDAERRIDVESFLAQHPTVAARVMADMCIRDAARLQRHRRPAEPPKDPRVPVAARRLERKLEWLWWLRGMVNAATAAAYITIGVWCGMQLWPSSITPGEAMPPPPSFVTDAARAHRVSLIRLGMISQDKDTSYDAHDILEHTSLLVPTIPAQWRLLDAQVYPASSGASVEMLTRVPDGRALSIFTVRSPGIGRSKPRLSEGRDATSLWWYDGGLAHAITGPFTTQELRVLAQQLR